MTRTASAAFFANTPVRRDLAYLITLAGLAALPLVALRHAPLGQSPLFLAALALLGGTLAVQWLLASPSESIVPSSTNAIGFGTACRTMALPVGALTIVTVLGFLGPALRQFWSGYDDFLIFDPEFQRGWSSDLDAECGRPLSVVVPWLAATLAGARVEAFLALGTLFILLNGVLLWAILSRLFPQSRQVPLAAAVLLVCHRGDPMAFCVLWPGNGYWPGVFFLLLGVWVLLVSYDRQSRGLLLLACGSLAVSLLIHEAGLPLALLAAVLLWLRHRQGEETSRPRPNTDWRVWAFAWLATAGVLAGRFAQLLLAAGGAKYQQGLLERHSVTSANLLDCFRQLLAPAGTYFAPCPYLPVAVVSALVVAAVVAIVVGWLGRGAIGGLRVRALAVGLAVAGSGTLLALAPFVPLTDTARTQFYAAPVEAVFLALGLALVCNRLRGAVGRLLFAGAVALLAGHATALSYYRQETAIRDCYYEKTTYILHQLHGILPEPRPGVVILAFVSGEGAPPFRVNYAAAHLSRLSLGTLLVQADTPDPYHPVTVLPDSVLVPHALTSLMGRALEGDRFSFDRVIAVRISRDGTVSVLPTLPAELPVDPAAAARYDPLALLRPGPVGPARIMNYPFWFPPPSDVVEQHTGVLLGRGWSEMEWDGQAFFREATGEAEIVVNSQGQAARECTLEIDPGPAAARVGCRLVARNAKGREAAAAPLTGRQVVHLTLPCPADRAGLFRLRLEEPDGPAGGRPFRALCLPGGPPMRAYVPPEPDITDEGLRIGPGWYPLERWEGETFRWVNTDAVLRTPGRWKTGSRRLLLTVEPGPGMEALPCRMRLVDGAGRTLASAEARGREEVSFALPSELSPQQPLKLCVDGGGHPTPGDPRTLNVRVFRCRWGP